MKFHKNRLSDSQTVVTCGQRDEWMDVQIYDGDNRRIFFLQLLVDNTPKRLLFHHFLQRCSKRWNIFLEINNDLNRRYAQQYQC
jgi:hypothetical protein